MLKNVNISSEIPYGVPVGQHLGGQLATIFSGHFLQHYFPFSFLSTFLLKGVLGSKKCRKADQAACREYVQHCVCFVNEQVPWPDSNIIVKFCTSRLCMKMSSFLFVRTGNAAFIVFFDANNYIFLIINYIIY